MHIYFLFWAVISLFKKWMVIEGNVNTSRFVNSPCFSFGMSAVSLTITPCLFIFIIMFQVASSEKAVLITKKQIFQWKTNLQVWWTFNIFCYCARKKCSSNIRSITLLVSSSHIMLYPKYYLHVCQNMLHADAWRRCRCKTEAVT